MLGPRITGYDPERTLGGSLACCLFRMQPWRILLSLNLAQSLLRRGCAVPCGDVAGSFRHGINILRRGRDKSLRMKILLVDDHALIRDALRGVIKDLMDDASVLEASDCRQAMRLIQDHPDLHLILLDLNLPDRSGFAVLADLRQRYAMISIVVLSTINDRDSVLRALNLGALGFIPKSSPREVMVNALRLVFSGGIYVPPEALAPVETKEMKPARPASPAAVGLTERQIEVLALLMRGKSNKAISRLLDMAEPTVKHHVTAILKALRATNRTEAVIAVGELGWQLPRGPE
jgi:DNA-binding NarL/FixJ family response regulator